MRLSRLSCSSLPLLISHLASIRMPYQHGIEEHETRQQRTDEERQNGGMKNHGALPPVMHPSRISTTSVGREESNTIGSWLAIRMVFPSSLKEPTISMNSLGELGVQVGGRLIGDDDRRVVDQGPGNGHPLDLAPGEKVNPRSGMPRDIEHLQQLHCPFCGPRLPFAGRIGRKHHVFQDGYALAPG